MLVSYNKVANDKEFDFVGSVDVGSKYPRNFWKEKSSGKVVCYWAISNTYNKEEMAIVHSEISDRVTSVAFAKGTKKGQDPMWELVGVDKDGDPKSVRYTHSEMVSAFTGSVLLDMPFSLGKNFWDRYGNIEASTPKGSEIPEASKSMF